MTTTQMAYFIAMAERLSFTEVAEQFYVTQPTLSRQIMNLESELGVQLFVRKSNLVAITPAGTELYEGLKPLYHQLCRVTDFVRRHNMPQKTAFTIGVAEELLLDDPVQLAIGVFTVENPDIAVTIQRASYADIASGLKDGNLAVADTISSSFDMERDQFDFLLIEEEGIYLACSKEMRATLPDTLTIPAVREILRHNRLLLGNFKSFGEEAYVPTDVLYDAFGPFDFEPELQMVGSPLSIPSQVASGLGVSLCNKSNFFAIDPKTAIVPIDAPHGRGTSYPKGLAYSRRNHSPLLGRFLEIVRGLIADKK